MHPATARNALNFPDVRKDYICSLASYYSYYNGKNIFQNKMNHECIHWKMKWSNCEFFENKITDTQAYVITSEDVMILVFRGTELKSWRDWLTDINCKKVAESWQYPEYKVHRGFKKAFDSVFVGKLPNYIADKIGDRELWITGHSLGGALATVAAYHVTFQGVKVRKVCRLVTFGSPCVGNKDFTERIDRIPHLVSVRYVYGSDIVPLALQLLFWKNFAHVRVRKPISESDEIGEESSYHPTKTISDHLIKNYRRALKKGCPTIKEVVIVNVSPRKNASYLPPDLEEEDEGDVHKINEFVLEVNRRWKLHHEQKEKETEETEET